MPRGGARRESEAARRLRERQEYERRHTIGRPHPDRARQFMPFAALRGYYDLVHAQEAVPEPRRPLTEEEARVLGEQLASLERGKVVRATYYRDGAYREAVGAVSQVDTIYRTLWVVRTAIPFDDLRQIEPL